MNPGSPTLPSDPTPYNVLGVGKKEEMRRKDANPEIRNLSNFHFNM
jgi:hypothetical protein